MFDARRFLIENFQTPYGLIATFNAFGMDIPPQDTVRKWFSRNTIPSEWLPMIIAVLELENGRPISLVPYVGGKTCNDRRGWKSSF